MNFDILISEHASQHLNGSHDWYESQQSLLGMEFLKDFSELTKKLAEGMIDYQIYHNDIRKARLNRFPFYVYYERSEENKILVVLAILHVKRNPEEIKKLISNK